MKPVAASKVEMTEIVLPHHTNAIGSVFGGTVMSWIDIAAAIAAFRHAGKQVVTASVDALEFLAPIQLGWIVTIRASVNYVSRRSCEVGVKVYAEDPKANERYHTATAYVTMVALDSMGKPTAMVPIDPQTADEKRRYDQAQIRRQARLELKKRNRQHRVEKKHD